MRITFVVMLFISLVSCKTARSRATLSSKNSAHNGQNSTLQSLLSEYEFIGGYAEGKDPYGTALTKRDIKGEPSKTGNLSMDADGTYTLTINFAAGTTSAGTCGPGALVSINPDSEPKVEQYTVGIAGWVGDDSKEERKVETMEGFEAGEPNYVVTLSERVSMFSRPYKWFNKNSWKAYKTITKKIALTTDTATFSSYADENGGYKDYLQLNFRRKKSTSK